MKKMLLEPMAWELVACARICHHVNRAYAQTLNDYSHSNWDDAPTSYKDAVFAQVRAHIDSGFTLTPESAHKSWVAAKKADGWKHGAEKNVDTKRHPAMVPYNELPAEQQVKDRLFRSVVHAFFATHLNPHFRSDL